ncbi:hypothetical protein ACFQ2B_39950 [Streptomyces stramineus]
MIECPSEHCSLRSPRLREQAAAQGESTAAAPWADRLPELPARSLDSDATGEVIA